MDNLIALSPILVWIIIFALVIGVLFYLIKKVAQKKWRNRSLSCNNFLLRTDSYFFSQQFFYGRKIVLGLICREKFTYQSFLDLYNSKINRLIS